ncbi:MAG TPA: transposase [Opitutaceae bacterium]
MARKLRIQYEGAIYHVINRGNYRRDVFESVGAAQAFLEVLGEACTQHRWKLHAYVVMRNHYHLAVETPEPNLIEGMHWLQSTFATRFNRFRNERGHLFQGRYQALLVENAAAVLRVTNYIHLNPVRAKVVPTEHVAAFRWSSLPRLVKAGRPSWLVAKDLLEQLCLTDTPEGWRSYVDYLITVSGDPAEQERQGFGEMSRGWAIGTAGWRRAIARDHAHLALSAGIESDELREIKAVRYVEMLERILLEAGKTPAELQADAHGAPWKIAAASRLRLEVGAPYPWIATALNMGSPSSVRVYLSAARRN